MALSNEMVIKRAITTDDIQALGASGGNTTVILPDDDGKKFVDGVYDQSDTLSKVRAMRQRKPKMRINKMFVRSRILRAGGENKAPTLQKPITFGNIVLEPKKLDLAYELTLEAIEDNLEMEAFEAHTARLVEQQIARDLNFLLWRGDTTDFSGAATTINQVGGMGSGDTAEVIAVSTAAFPDTSVGFGFLLIDSERISYESKNDTTNKFLNLTRGEDETDAAAHANGAAITFADDALLKVYDGIIKLVKASGSIVDPTVIADGTVHPDLLHSLIDGIPQEFLDSTKYSNQFRWFANKKFIRRWARLFGKRQTDGGDRAVAMGLTADDLKSPLGYSWHPDESVPDGTVVFGPQKGVVHSMRTRGIRYTQTSEGKDLASRDATYYKWAMWADATLDDAEAFAIAEGVSMAMT